MKLFVVLNMDTLTKSSDSDGNGYTLDSVFSFITLLVLYACGRYIYGTYSYLDVPDVKSLKEIFILPPGDFAPENAEKLAFISSILLCPTLLLIMNLAYSRIGRLRIFLSEKNNLIISRFLTVALLLLFVVDIKPGRFYFLHSYFSRHPVWNTLLFLSAIFLGFNYCKFFNARIRSLLFAVATGGFYILALLMMATIFITPLFDSRALESGAAFRSNFNAFFYSFSQVFAGKALLVDFLNQYGLYPHFLAPLFRIFGFGMLQFTLVQSSLITITFISLFVFMRRMLKNTAVLYSGFIMLLFYAYFFLVLTNKTEFYFAYYPLRSIFPALLIALSGSCQFFGCKFGSMGVV